MTARVARLVLAISGVVLAWVGIAVLFYPDTFAAANGVLLPDDPSTLSEFRAPGGLLLASAAFVLLAVVRTRHVQAALVLAAAVFGSYGIARLVGFLVDGAPSTALLQAMAAEWCLGIICVVTWVFVNSHKHQMEQR